MAWSPEQLAKIDADIDHAIATACRRMARMHDDALRARNAEIIRLHSEGQTYVALSGKFGLSCEGIRHIVFIERQKLDREQKKVALKAERVRNRRKREAQMPHPVKTWRRPRPDETYTQAWTPAEQFLEFARFTGEF
jgi:hypothetical protein